MGFIAKRHMAEHPAERYQPKYEWPDGCDAQWGPYTIQRMISEWYTDYSRAFFEIFPENPNTYVRGEGANVPAAEEDCWNQWQKMLNCTNHLPIPESRLNHMHTCVNCGMSINFSAIEYEKRRIKVDEFPTFDDYETALGELMSCSTAWEPEARILGNVKASTITGICQRAYYDAKRLLELEKEGEAPEPTENDMKMADWYRQILKIVSIDHMNMRDKALEDIVHDMSAVSITIKLSTNGLSVKEAIEVGLWSEGGGKG